MISRKVFALSAFVGLALTLAGCGSTAKPVVAVSGKITFEDGTNIMEGAKVVLNPAEGNMGTASGVVGADGSFTLTHVTGRSGAEVGKYNVSLLSPDGKEKEFFGSIPGDYTNGGMLTADVQAGMAPLAFKVAKKK